jgi:hypothetical protein
MPTKEAPPFEQIVARNICRQRGIDPDLHADRVLEEIRPMLEVLRATGMLSEKNKP